MNKHTLGSLGLALSLAMIATDLLAATISISNPFRKVQTTFTVLSYTRDFDVQSDSGTSPFNASVSVDAGNGYTAQATVNSSALTGSGFTISGDLSATGNGGCSGTTCPSGTQALHQHFFSFSLDETTALKIDTTWDITKVGNAGFDYSPQIKQGTALLYTTSGDSGSDTTTLTLGPGNYSFLLNASASATGAIGSLSDGSVSGSYQFSLTTVPVPAAVWLFGSGLIGMIGVAKRKST